MGSHGQLRQYMHVQNLTFITCSYTNYLHQFLYMHTHTGQATTVTTECDVMIPNPFGKRSAMDEENERDGVFDGLLEDINNLDGFFDFGKPQNCNNGLFLVNEVKQTRAFKIPVVNNACNFRICTCTLM